MEKIVSDLYGVMSDHGGLLKLVLSEDVRGEVSHDSIIPDTFADAEAVLLCSACPRIEDQYLANHQLVLEGVVDYQVLLRTEDGDLVNLTICEPFDLKTDCNCDTAEPSFFITQRTETAEAKLLNPRKLNLRTAFVVTARVLASVDPSPEIVGAESIDDDMNLQRAHKTVQVGNFLTLEERQISVCQDLELDSNEPPIAEILSCHVLFFPTDIKGSADDARARFDVMVSLLYRSEEGNCFNTEKRFSTEHPLSLPCHEGTDWIAQGTPTEAVSQVSANSYGEMKIVELDIGYNLKLVGVRNQTIHVATDMYSTELECSVESDTVPVVKLHRVYNTGLSVNATIARSEVNGEAVRGILTGSINICSNNVQYNSEKNKFQIEGVAIVSLVADNNTMDSTDPIYTPITFRYPFKCDLDAVDAPTDGDFLFDYKIGNYRFRADSGHICADIELAIRIVALSKENITFVKRVILDHSGIADVITAPITLCYPSGKETLWDIAKYYKITEESIRVSNGMTDDNIQERKVLLILRSGPKRAVFSKVI